MKTPIIRLLILSAALMCNAAFAESGYVQHVRKNAEDGQAWAEKSMGDILYFGIDMENEESEDNMNEEEKRKKMEEKFKKVEENRKKAVEWYLKSAEQGESSAMYAVGRSYYFGEGVEEDDKKAAEWYHKAADAGDAESLYPLARMYEHGIGIDQDIPEAAKFYKKAIYEHSHANSLYPLYQIQTDNPVEVETDIDPLVLLILAAHYVGNTSAKSDLDGLYLSPVHEKNVWDLAEEIYYNRFNVDWEYAAEKAVSGISVKMAVAKSASESLSAEEVFNRVWRSVVYIETDGIFNGSGVIVQPDIVATNCHVVEDAKEIWVYQSKERSGRNNIPHRASVPVQSGRDYCLLHVPNLPGSGVPATIRRYDTLNIGETVYALGAPNGEKLSLSKGIISQLRDEEPYIYSAYSRYDHAPAIQSDVDFAGGSSGGGLFDSAGNLIGHTTKSSIDDRGIDLEGLEFSIPADLVLEFGKESKVE